MESLSITLIDVGWGDSILIEYTYDNKKSRFALIDSNESNVEKKTAAHFELKQTAVDFFTRRQAMKPGGQT